MFSPLAMNEEKFVMLTPRAAQLMTLRVETLRTGTLRANAIGSLVWLLTAGIAHARLRDAAPIFR